MGAEDLFPQGEQAVKKLSERGTFGETVLHACMLAVGLHADRDDASMQRCVKIAMRLIKSYGPNSCFDLVNAQYHIHHPKLGTGNYCGIKNCLCWDDAKSLFEGEAALHMAIAFNHSGLVQLLLENGAKLDLRARGPFFSPSGSCYYGELPLSFAASLNRVDMIQMIVDHHRDPLQTVMMDQPRSNNFIERRQRVFSLVLSVDTYGNNAVHLAVNHERKEAFDLLMVVGREPYLSEEEHKSDIGKAKELFEALDYDGSNTLSKDEFVHLVQHMYDRTPWKRKNVLREAMPPKLATEQETLVASQLSVSLGSVDDNSIQRSNSLKMGHRVIHRARGAHARTYMSALPVLTCPSDQVTRPVR